MSRPTLEGQSIGKYRVLEALGRGGMAQVYRAYHPQLERYAAIKVLRSDLADDEEFLARFQREARAIASLRHHNIIHVFDFDHQNDIYYMVMELLEGDSLRERLIKYRTSGKRMPLPEVVEIIKDVLDGLGYAHSQGLIHRDIKPANIMLTMRGEAVVTDFGIAQIMGGTQYTVSGALMGTLSYMAPEQGLQGNCDRRSDLYSLGIVLYEMLTGFTPFDADTPLAILMKHLHDPLPLPRQVDPGLPEPFEQIVLKALAKEPADRYQTCQQMADDLARISPDALPDGVRIAINNPNSYDPKAVFSGTSRQKITDLRLSKQDTDPDLARSAHEMSEQRSTNTADKPLPAQQQGAIQPLNVATAVLGGLAGMLLINFFAMMVSTLFNLHIFERGWPFELFLAAGFLALLMWAVETHWLLIPIGIFFGNALLLAYCAVSGRWGDWTFLWMLEPLIIGVSIYVPIHMQRDSPQIKVAARNGGELFTALSILLASITCLLALAAGLLGNMR